jgi:hypothetical protein
VRVRAPAWASPGAWGLGPGTAVPGFSEGRRLESDFGIESGKEFWSGAVQVGRGRPAGLHQPLPRRTGWAGAPAPLSPKAPPHGPLR